jgi:hypothetical protein
MTIKKISQITLCFLLTSCSNEGLILPIPIPKHIDNEVVLSKGINFNTKKQVVLDPYTGEEVKPCIKQKADNEKENCIELVDPNPLVQNILENAQFPISVKVKRNGKIIDEHAVAVVTVDVLFQGSHCEASYNSGTQTVNCTSIAINTCRTYLPYRHAHNNPPSVQQIVNYCETHFWH